MDLVADANIILAICIANGTTAQIFFDDNTRIYVPECIWHEFQEHASEIYLKSRRSDFAEIVKAIEMKAIRVPSLATMKHVPALSESAVDMDDIEYLAAALTVRCALWSNDRALQKQNLVEVITTEELLHRYRL
jgi:predicted nucleic acid-binding protein